MLSIRRKCSVQGMYFHHLHLYSTKSPNQTIKSPNQTYSNYLVNNLGFSQQEAHSTSTKIQTKYENYSKFSNNANSVVDFLKQHGFEDTHLKKVVSSYPQILASNIDKTLIPKFKLLQDHGFSGSDLVSVISANPSFVTTSSIENLVSNVALLNNEYGLDIHVIRNSILQQASSFLRKPEFFRNVLIRVEEELGIPRISRMFFYGIKLLSCYSKEVIESKCQALRSFGWTEYDVSELMRRNPSAFQKSEENIRKKLGFLMTQLGYDPDFLARRGVLFTLSLEKRMVPRHRVLLVLKEKGLLDYDFCTAVKKSEKQFLKMLIEPFKKDAPGLLELYQSNKGCSKIDAISRHR